MKEDNKTVPQEPAPSTRAVGRRTVVKATAWSVPVIAAAVAVPAHAASTQNNAKVVDIWYPQEANIPGYVDDTDGHSNYLSDANGQTWPYGWTTFRNNGPDPLPAGTVLRLAYDTPGFAPPTVRGSTVPGGISSATYSGSGPIKYVDVVTVAPIPAGQQFSVDYTYVTSNASARVYTFTGSIVPPTDFGDSYSSDNTMTSGEFGLGTHTNLQASGVWHPAGSNVPGFVANSSDGSYSMYHDNGTVWSLWTAWKNNGPGDLPAGTALNFNYDARYFDDPTLSSSDAPGSVGRVVYSSTDGSPSGTGRTITVCTNEPIPAGTSFTVNYRIAAQNVSADSPLLTFSQTGIASGDSNASNDGLVSGKFQIVNR